MAWANEKPVIGLTGGIGSGKSSVARLMGERGCAVISADQLAQDALDDRDVRAAIEKRWGQGVFDSQGAVDRAALASRVFDDPRELDALEQIVHPRVHAARHEMRQAYFADPNVTAVVEDCPLLLEKQIDRECDRVVFVDAPLSARLHRVASQRGWSEQGLLDREKNQFGLDFKKQKADYVIVNDAGEAQLVDQVRGVLSQIL